LLKAGKTFFISKFLIPFYCNIEGAFIHLKAENILVDLLDNANIKNIIAKGVYNE
jgi:hypothetical protein